MNAPRTVWAVGKPMLETEGLNTYQLGVKVPVFGYRLGDALIVEEPEGGGSQNQTESGNQGDPHVHEARRKVIPEGA
jgi:hypothetical protein